MMSRAAIRSAVAQRLVSAGTLRNMEVVTWQRYPVMVRNCMSTVAVDDAKAEKTTGGGDKEVVSYWGISPTKVTKEDGSEWKWNSFRPWETYKSDLTIDLKKHHAPITFLDKVAYYTVKAMRLPTDIFFQLYHKGHTDVVQ